MRSNSKLNCGCENVQALSSWLRWNQDNEELTVLYIHYQCFSTFCMCLPVECVSGWSVDAVQTQVEGLLGEDWG